MYLIPIETKVSPINGKGVFTLCKISEGDLVWKFDKNHDKSISIDEYNNSIDELKKELDRVAYLSPTSNSYVYPPEDDPARFTNHSKENNLTVVIDINISEEPYFIANRDIEEGEELTNNYLEFDKALEAYKPEWI